MTPKSTPKLSQKASSPKMPFKTGPHFSIVFLTIFRAKTVARIDPKITQKSTSAPQGLPEAAREPFRSHFGAILALPAPLAYHFSPSAAYCASFLLSVCLAFLFCALCFALCLLPSCVLRSVAGSGAHAPVRSGHRASRNERSVSGRVVRICAFLKTQKSAVLSRF